MGKVTAAAGTNNLSAIPSSLHDKRAVSTLLRCTCNTSGAVCSCPAAPRTDQPAYSSSKLLEVLQAYEQKHPGRLKKDLERNVDVRALLKFGTEGLELNEQLTDAQVHQLLSVLKHAKHGLLKNVKISSPSHLRKDLKAAWGETKSDSKLQAVKVNTPAGHDGIKHGARADAPPSTSLPAFADSTKEALVVSGLYESDASIEAPVQQTALPERVTDRGGEDDFQVVQGKEGTKASDVDVDQPGLTEEELDETNPFKGGVDLPSPDCAGLDDSNPFGDGYDEQMWSGKNADLTGLALTQTQTQSPASDQADGTSEVFLQMLNAYLKTKDGTGFGKVNKVHVDKLSHDIKKYLEAIGQYITLEKTDGEYAVRWKGGPVSKENVQGMLDAFKKEHAGTGSFYKLIANFAFAEAGYRLIDETTHEQIISRAAEPSLHRPGKSAVVEMKRTVMTEVLEFFSRPERHDEPLPDGILTRLIAHYGRVEQIQSETQHSAERLAANNELSLNDKGILESIKRLFHQIETEQRIDRFEGDVEEFTIQFEKQTATALKKVVEKHASEDVVQRTVGKINEGLSAAYKAYNATMSGANIYPAKLSENSPVPAQIKRQVKSDHERVLQSVVTNYEESYMKNLIEGGESFSASDYFNGKSREKATDNVVKLNQSLGGLPERAEALHGKNLHALAKLSGSSTSQEMLDRQFQGHQQKLVDTLKTKILANNNVSLKMYDQDIEKIKWDRFGKISADLVCAQKLASITQGLKKDVEKIHAQKFPSTLKIAKEDLVHGAEEVTKPLLVKLKELLPEVPSIGKTLQSAFARAFKPTPVRVLGSIPLVGGLTFALAALPTAIAVPLGITAAVVLPLALLGWVGWNIYKRFDQRSEIQHLRTQMEGHFKDIETAGI